MSSNVSNTNQHDAVASGSDTDSVISLAQRPNEMNVDGSSSPIQSAGSSNTGGPAESASSGSDNNDDTIVKDPAEDQGNEAQNAQAQDDEENDYLCFDKSGNRCDENTPFDQFKRWPAYLGFCDMGPQFKIRLAVCDEDGDTIGYVKKSYSRKFLCDFSEYFTALCRSQMLEATLGYVNLEDVDVEDFDALMLVIRAGLPLSKVNVGPGHRTLSNYLNIYILADRFMMPMIKPWATAAMEEYLRETIGWAALWQHQVVDQPHMGANTGAGLVHEEKVMDFSDAWARSDYLPDENLPIQQHRYQQYLLNYCPRHLLCSKLEDMHPKLVTALCKAALIR